LEGNHRGRYGVAVTRLLSLSVVLFVGCGGSQPSEPLATTEPSAAAEEHPVEQPPVEQPPVDDGTGPAADSQDVREALASANQLGFDLYARLRGTPGNLVMSPASVHLALSMTYAGARGETASQMASVLHVEPSGGDLDAAYGAALRSWNSRSPATLRVANRIFADRSVPVEESFVTLTGRRYGAPLERLDFVKPPTRRGSPSTSGWSSAPKSASRTCSRGGPSPAHAHGVGQRHLLQGHVADPVRPE
jgi:serpin B